jgi:ABC-2 type transport system permease protein
MRDTARPNDSTSIPTRSGGTEAHLFATTATMFVRGMRLSTRNVDAIITALALPVMLMLMFVYLFGGAIHTGDRYVNYVVPGVLLICTAFGSGTTALTVGTDLAGGVIDRFRSMDVSPRALINGHVLASVVRNLVSTAIVIAVAVAIGFRPAADAAAWLAAIGLLALFILALSWLAAAVGVTTRTPEAASGAMFVVLFLPYATSAFVPISTMPTWLRGFATYQPANQVIVAVRDLLTGGPVADHAITAIVWSITIAAGAAAAAGILYARRMRRR